MRLTATTKPTDQAAEKLIEALASEAPGFDEGSDAFCDYVRECAREAVDEAITDFEPMSREEWAADGEESEAADRELARSWS